MPPVPVGSCSGTSNTTVSIKNAFHLLDWQFVDADAELGNHKPALHSSRRTLDDIHHHRLARLIVVCQVRAGDSPHPRSER